MIKLGLTHSEELPCGGKEVADNGADLSSEGGGTANAEQRP